MSILILIISDLNYRVRGVPSLGVPFVQVELFFLGYTDGT